ncbi:hypothetical protein amrb99_26540 [Actinomadura sp. RB99]|uniref:DMT family transporter n=1 Tax=Actinomadura sp. RB99 TaxID=2691577 RepID=UPI00168A1AAB|nr:DMT family transporter [Actinomadura sp. RB99]MBD2893732.1 hypothetical protein [Actinomadura sp. RB99]
MYTSRGIAAVPHRDALLGAAIGTVFVVTWSSGFIGAQLGAGAAPASTLLAWRFIVAGGLLLAWAAWRRPRIPRRDLVLHLIIGALGQGGYLYGVFAAAEHGVSAGVDNLITALQPLLAAVLAVPVLGERITRRQLAGFAAGLGGVALVVGGDLRGGAPPWAYALPLAATLCLVGATLLERRTRPSIGLVDALTVQAGISALLFTALAGATGDLAPPADPAFWTAVAVLVVMAMFGGYGLYWVNVRRSGVGRASALLYLTPPATMLGAWALFGSTLAPLSLAGVLACAAAVAVVLRAPAAGARRSGDGRRASGRSRGRRAVAARVRGAAARVRRAAAGPEEWGGTPPTPERRRAASR